MRTKKQIWQALNSGAVAYARHSAHSPSTWWLAVPDCLGADQQIAEKLLKRLMNDHYIQSETRCLLGPDSGVIHVTYWTQSGAQKTFYNRFRLNNKE